MKLASVATLSYLGDFNHCPPGSLYAFCFMLTVSLLSDPTSPRLYDSRPVDLSMRWSGSRPLWLSSGTACEFSITVWPPDFESARKEFDQIGVDLNIVPSAGRRKKLLVADMDSTIIEQECIDELADEAGVGERVAGITARAMNGEIDFKEALRERVSLLEGLPESVIETVWHRRISLTPGAEALVATMKRRGARAILISGGFTGFTGRVASRLGFDEHYANRLRIKDGRLTGIVEEPPLGKEAKREILSRILSDSNLSSSEAIAVGDGSNDIDMLSLAGVGVAFRAKPAVNRASSVRIRHCDLTGLLFIQGLSQSDFCQTLQPL